jgi:hypothetical protein
MVNDEAESCESSGASEVDRASSSTVDSMSEDFSCFPASTKETSFDVPGRHFMAELRNFAT